MHRIGEVEEIEREMAKRRRPTSNVARILHSEWY